MTRPLLSLKHPNEPKKKDTQGNGGTHRLLERVGGKSDNKRKRKFIGIEHRSGPPSSCHFFLPPAPLSTMSTFHSLTLPEQWALIATLMNAPSLEFIPYVIEHAGGEAKVDESYLPLKEPAKVGILNLVIAQTRKPKGKQDAEEEEDDDLPELIKSDDE